MSGLPKPRSMTSSPARRAAALSPSMIVKTYGGSALIRRNSMPVRLSVDLPGSGTALFEHVDHRGAGIGEDAAQLVDPRAVEPVDAGGGQHVVDEALQVGLQR